MIYLLFISLIINVNAWSPSSWRGKPVTQIPTYPDLKELKKVEEQLHKKTPLIFAAEADTLQEKIAKASFGDGFILMGGDCSESFKDFSVNRIKNDYKLMLQMNLILAYALGVPIIKISRSGGQFAKPRSNEFEIIDGKEVLTYRGDIINSINNREPNPQFMLDAYHQSVQTLNILRAFSSGGFADVNTMFNNWNIQFDDNNEIKSKYGKTVEDITQSLKFMKALGLNTKDQNIQTTNIYTAHEALLLNYEEGLTRVDSRNNKYYSTSSHMLWVGERTRNPSHAHIEFLSGIENVIGIKVSEKCTSEELINLIKILNPNNTPGKILVISRMGKHIKNVLPNLIRAVQNQGFIVGWISDVMHGNTITINGIKTRKFDDVKDEIINFFDIHKKMGSIAAGIHLELTSDNVTECIGGSINEINCDELSKNYLSLCDPRLNHDQSIELSFLIAEKFKKY